jgi:hypothetical protein
MKQKFHAINIDVEIAFLHGDIEEAFYMDAPPGLNHHEGECVKLDKGLYGLVQAVRQFFKKFTMVLENIGFKEVFAELCLFTKHDK